MNDCIFCKIAKKEIPAEIVYESDTVLGFKDINPAAPAHILFIPKKHYSTLNDIPSEGLCIYEEMMRAAQSLAKEMGVSESGYRILTNVNPDAGQEVFHVHMHLIGGRKLGKMA